MKKSARLLSIVLALLMVISMVPFAAFAETGTDVGDVVSVPDKWDGTADTTWYNTTDEKFTLSTAEQLAGLSILSANGNTFSGKTIVLDADMDLDGKQWTPIKQFSGTFDGGEHTVSNFTLDGAAGRAGFIQNLGQYPATVKNLTLSKVIGTAASNQYFGILVANGHTSILENVHVVDCEITTTNKDAWVGGIYGYFNWTSASNCTVKNLVIDATNGAKFIGGFSGNMDQDLTINNVDITGLKITLDATNGACQVGGFTGQTQTGHRQPTFNNCDVKDLEIVAKGEVQLGGFVGDAGAHTIANNCTVDGKIDASGVTDDRSFIGGFMADSGWNNNESSKGGHKLTDCSTNVDIITGGSTAGGFIGSTTAYHPTNRDDNRNMPITMENCSATGTVSVAEGATATIGGFAGEADRGTFRYCVADQKEFIGCFLPEPITPVIIVNYVAQIGETRYTSLQAAVDAANPGDTVKLLSDIALTEADRVVGADLNVLIDVDGKDITLDMNGKKISVVHEDAFADDYIVAVIRVADGAGLTVTGNGTIDIKVLKENPDLAYMFWKRGTTGHLTIENGTYHMNDSADAMIYTNGDEIVTVKGGTFTLDAYGTRVNEQPWIFNAKGQNTANIIVTGGTFNADIIHQYYPFEVMAPKEKALDEGADGMWSFTDAVAYVNEQEWSSAWYTNEVGYATLEKAIAAVEDIRTKSGKTSPEEFVTVIGTLEITESVANENYRKIVGKIVLKDRSATLKAPENDGLNVTSGVPGYKVEYAEGVYKLIVDKENPVVTINFKNGNNDVTLKYPSERFDTIQKLIGTNDYADFVIGASESELLAYIPNGNASDIVITLHDDIELDAPINFYNKYFQLPVEYAVTLDGNGNTITWADGYTGTLFNVESGVSLTTKNLTIDGENAFTFYNDTTAVENGQNWYTRFVDVGEEDKAVNANVIVNAGNLTLGEGTTIKNVTVASDGDNGKTSNTETGGFYLMYNDDLALIKSNGGKVNLNGAEIIGNAGMVLSAINATTEIKDSTINGNMGAGNKGGIIIANGGTMNIAGGSISNNKAMARSATILGVINGAEVTFSATMENNKHIGVGSNTAGAMVVLEGASQFVMDGGSISNNVGGRAGAIASRWVGGNYGLHEDTSIVLNAGEITDNTAANDSWSGASVFLRSPATIGEGMTVEGTIVVNAAPGELDITGGTFNGSLVVTEGLSAEITGGTFNYDPTEWCAEGLEGKDNGDGTWGVQEKILATLTFNFLGSEETYTYPGEGDGRTIDSLQDLITEYQYHSSMSFLGVPSNAVLTLNDDITLNETLVISTDGPLGEVPNYEFKLDLNGNTLTGMVENHVDLTVIDSVGGGKIDGGNAAAIDNYGKLVVDGGEFTGAICAIYNNDINPKAELTINGGKFTAPGDDCATIENYKGTLTVNGGTITATQNAGYAIVDTMGETTINGGEINSAAGTAVETYQGKITIKDGEFTGKVIVENQDGTVDVYGGTLVSNTPEYYYGLTCANGGVTTLYGGIYERDYATAEGTSVKIAEGYTTEELADGTYGVRKLNYIAEVNGVKYESLKEALEACTNGETVKLIADVTYDADDVVLAHGGATGFGKYDQYNPSIIYIGGTKGATEAENQPSNVNAVLDLNGHTITNNADAYLFLLMDNCKVTFTDSVGGGKVVTTTDAPVIWICGTDTLVTIEGGEYVTASATGLLHVTHSGDLVITGGEFKTTADDASLLIMLNSQPYNNPNYFLKGVATVTISDGTFYGFNPAKVGDDYKASSLEDIKFVDGCAEGYAPVNNGNGTYGVALAVAAIGDKNYASIKDAVAAAENGDVITILKDHEIDGSVFVNEDSFGYETLIVVEDGKEITIDFAGHTVSVTPSATNANGGLKNILEAVIFVRDNASLTLKDSVGNGGFKVNKGSTALYSLIYNNGSSLIIESGNYYVEEVYVTGSIIYQDIMDNGLNNTEIKGGTFTLGNVGTDSSTTKPWIFNVEGKNDDFVLVTGGTFNENILKNLGTQKDCEVDIPDGYALLDNNDGTWTVCEVVAQNLQTEKYYTDLSDALAEAKSGETVKLLRDCEESYVIVTPGVTLNISKYKLTAGYVVAFKDAHIVSSGRTNGRIFVAKDQMVVDANNKELPVYDAVKGCYMLSTINVSNFGAETEYVDAEHNPNPNKVCFIPLFAKRSTGVLDALYAGAENSGVKVVIRVTWTTDDFVATQDYAYKDEYMKMFLDGITDTNYTKMFTATFAGTEAIGKVATVTAVVISDTGAEYVTDKSIVYDWTNVQ